MKWWNDSTRIVWYFTCIYHQVFIRDICKFLDRHLKIQRIHTTFLDLCNKGSWFQLSSLENFNTWHERLGSFKPVPCQTNSGDKRSGLHYSIVIMATMASQNTSLTIVYSTVYSGADEKIPQSSASLSFACGIHRWPAQRASNAENVSIWWRHHVVANILCIGTRPFTDVCCVSSYTIHNFHRPHKLQNV